MTVEALIVVAVLTAGLWVIRCRWRQLADLWRAACWWEKAVLVFALMPVPGPGEEAAGILVARRIAARVAARG